ncbi:MAG: hypothetical protein AAFZ65_17545 [Planctomycetota bacterium]
MAREVELGRVRHLPGRYGQQGEQGGPEPVWRGRDPEALVEIEVGQVPEVFAEAVEFEGRWPAGVRGQSRTLALGVPGIRDQLDRGEGDTGVVRMGAIEEPLDDVADEGRARSQVVSRSE